MDKPSISTAAAVLGLAGLLASGATSAAGMDYSYEPADQLYLGTVITDVSVDFRLNDLTIADPLPPSDNGGTSDNGGSPPCVSSYDISYPVSDSDLAVAPGTAQDQWGGGFYFDFEAIKPITWTSDSCGVESGILAFASAAGYYAEPGSTDLVDLNNVKYYGDDLPDFEGIVRDAGGLDHRMDVPNLDLGAAAVHETQLTFVSRLSYKNSQVPNKDYYSSFGLHVLDD